MFKEPWLDLINTGTKRMRADIFTKGFKTPDEWGHACSLINHVDPNNFWFHNPRDEVIDFVLEPQVVTGGYAAASAAAPALGSALADVAAALACVPPTTKFALRKKGLRALHNALSKSKWSKGGELNDSPSVLLGADFDMSGPGISPKTDYHLTLIREVNSLLSHALRGVRCRWSCLLLEVSTTADTRGHAFADGPAYWFGHGVHQGTASVRDAHLCKGLLVSHDARCKLSLCSFSGFRIVVTACWHKGTESLSDADLSRLSEIGFPLDPQLSEPTGDVSALPCLPVPKYSHIIPSGNVQRTCIELCCAKDSKLGSDGPYNADCARYRFTAQEDLTSPNGLRLALLAVHESQLRARGHLLIWISIPCKGGGGVFF